METPSPLVRHEVFAWGATVANQSLLWQASLGWPQTVRERNAPTLTVASLRDDLEAAIRSAALDYGASPSELSDVSGLDVVDIEQILDVTRT